MFRLNTVKNDIDCAVFAEPDRRFAYGGKHFTEASYLALLGEMNKGCMKKGASFWTNLARKEEATRDVLAFLDAQFTRN